jgi:two-component system, OmpR family, KDP operon response regulator KdpE
MIRVMVVDDEPQLLRTLRISLSARRYEVLVAADGANALDLAARHVPDLVVLDLGLPDMDGTDVIAGLRGWSNVPILVLSGRTDAHDKVDALEAGADDYVTKPFSMDELIARLRVLLRHAESENRAPQLVVIGHHTVDFAAQTVLRTADAPGGAPEQVHLTNTEWAVLEILARNLGRLVSGKQILQRVWGQQYIGHTDYLGFFLARLRQKLEPEPASPRHLLTEPGMGYRFQP